jgi:hypothetical protein
MPVRWRRCLGTPCTASGLCVYEVSLAPRGKHVRLMRWVGAAAWRWRVMPGSLAAAGGRRGNGRLSLGRRHVKGDPANMHYINITHKPVVNVSFTNPDPDSPASGACTINGYLYRCAAPAGRSHSWQCCAFSSRRCALSTAAAQGLLRLQ